MRSLGIHTTENPQLRQLEVLLLLDLKQVYPNRCLRVLECAGVAVPRSLVAEQAAGSRWAVVVGFRGLVLTAETERPGLGVLGGRGAAAVRRCRAKGPLQQRRQISL
jgi:hypothetical protein